jgi:hypothetical protein
MIIIVLAPLPWERGWGEAINQKKKPIPSLYRRGAGCKILKKNWDL